MENRDMEKEFEGAKSVSPRRSLSRLLARHDDESKCTLYIDSRSRVRLLIYLLAHHLRIYTHIHTHTRTRSVTIGYDLWLVDKRDDPRFTVPYLEPEHRRQVNFTVEREDEAFRLRALANNRASPRNS